MYGNIFAVDQRSSLLFRYMSILLEGIGNSPITVNVRVF